jgi:hypothetical protein
MYAFVYSVYKHIHTYTHASSQAIILAYMLALATLVLSMWVLFLPTGR